MASGEWRMVRATRDLAIRYFAVRRRRIRKPHHRQPVAKLERGLEAFRKPRRHVGSDDDAVDDDFDVVLDLLVERRRIGDLVELPINLEPLEALFHQVGDLLARLAFAAARDRREEIEPRAL